MHACADLQKPRCSCQGTSLLELLTVIAILGMLLNLSVPRLSYPNQSVRMDSQVLAQCMTTLHHLSLRQGVEIDLAFDRPSNSINISSSSELQPLLQPLNQLCKLQRGTRIFSAQFAGGHAAHVVRYFPQGNATPGQIAVGSDAQPSCIINQPMYGLVSASCD